VAKKGAANPCGTSGAGGGADGSDAGGADAGGSDAGGSDAGGQEGEAGGQEERAKARVKVEPSPSASLKEQSRREKSPMEILCEKLFGELIPRFKKNAEFLTSIKSNLTVFQKIAKLNRDLINEKKQGIPSESELEKFLKYLVLVTLNLEDKEAYLDYDDNDVAIIISLFTDKTYTDEEIDRFLSDAELSDFGLTGDTLSFFGGKNKLKKKTKRNYVIKNKKTRRQY
jgi:hypothetical protein